MTRNWWLHWRAQQITAGAPSHESSQFYPFLFVGKSGILWTSVCWTFLRSNFSFLLHIKSPSSKNDEDQHGDNATGLKKLRPYPTQHTFIVACWPWSQATRKIIHPKSPAETCWNYSPAEKIHSCGSRSPDPTSPVFFRMSSHGNPNASPTIEDDYLPPISGLEMATLQ